MNIKTSILLVVISTIVLCNSLSLLFAQETDSSSSSSANSNTAPSKTIPSNSTTVQQYIRIWLSKNKYASQETILAFTNDYISTLSSIDDTYYVLVNIINSYPTNKISAEIYILFAKIASLKFDFSTASLMYYTSYNMTKNYHYLVQAAIQEFQNGHIDIANEYLTIAFENTLEPPTYITAVILKSELLLLTESPFQVLKFLEKEQYNIPPTHSNAAFLYQVYRIALLSNQADAAKQIHTLLQKKFPDSIETQTIDNKHIAPLPLPSLLFNTSFSHDLLSSRNTQKSNTSNDASPLFSKTPAVGYQVASYTKLSNATQSLEYFKNIWETLQTNTSMQLSAPILVKKTISKKLYYQIIFPLHTSDGIRSQQTLILQDKNIEGFMIFNN